MRLATLRSDIGPFFVADIESRSQRCFSSEPPGQTRYFALPSAASFSALLAENAPVTLLGTNAGDFNTAAGANVLVIKDSATGSNKTITVTAGAAVTAATIVTDLNAGFTTNGLRLVARATSGDEIAIDTTGTNQGESAYIKVDSTSTLETVLGLGTGAITGVDMTSDLLAAIYTGTSPLYTAADLQSATILGESTFSDLSDAGQAALVSAIQDFLAPSLVETGPVLLSYVYGQISKFAATSFQPGGERAGYDAGAAFAVLDDDGAAFAL